MLAPVVAPVVQMFPQDTAPQVARILKTTTLTLSNSKAAVPILQNCLLEIGVLRVVVS